jgi:starch synthase
VEHGLRSLFVTAEVTPFARTGGLGDVTGALPKVLAQLGHDVRIVMPLYQTVRDGAFSLTELLTDLPVPLVIGRRTARVWQGYLPELAASSPQVPVYFIEQDDYFARPGLYGDASGDYPDNALRFVFFCRAALALTERLGWFPHIFHCHDWHTGLIPAYLRFLPGLPAPVSAAATVFTIHNFAYQGIFPSWAFPLTGLPLSLFQSDGIEFFGFMNCMKAALMYANVLTAVSPTYAEEICTSEFGFGLDSVVRSRRDALVGILNGADYELWDPATDSFVAARYRAEDLSGKAVCKTALLRTYGLPEDQTTPLIGLISRLVDQKGIDLFTAALNSLLGLNVRFVILGSGETRYEDLLTRLAQLYPDRVGVRIGFDTALAHQIQAGSDMLLVPSRYEPCGLTQIYSLRYGTVPIVRATGGLRDTVVPFDPVTGQGTGFLFYEPRPEALVAAVREAVGVWTERDTWQQVVRNAMAQDFSWARPAARYIGLYRQVVAQRQGTGAPAITFDPAGWRARVADEFTHDRVAIVSRAITDHLANERIAAPRLLVTHDTRFLGREFAETAAKVCTAAGIQVTMSTTPLPTPVVAFEILRRRLDGAINVTACRDSYRWNGLKFSSARGGPASPETAREISQLLNARLTDGPTARLTEEEACRAGLWVDEDIGEFYRQALERLIDGESIRHAGVTVAVDLLWGTASGFLDRLLHEWGALGAVLHERCDAYLGGSCPDPVPPHLGDLVALLRKGGYTLGVGCDCDADRFGVCDHDGTFVAPNCILPLLLDYLVTHRGFTGKVGRSVTTSHLLDAVARYHGLEVVETPVGFHDLGAMLARNELLLGGEESGGFSMRGHVPERDGILACLLTVEMVARTGKSLKELLTALVAQVGSFSQARREVRLTPAQQERLQETLASPPEQLAGFSVERIVTLDGLKLYLGGKKWLFVQSADAQPMVRLYAEAENERTVHTLLQEAQQVFLD